MSVKRVVQEIKEAIYQTDAIWGFGVRMASTHAVDKLFRPVFKALDAEHRLDEIVQKGDKAITNKLLREFLRK